MTTHADSPDFDSWVQRPDSHGRMGWEAPDLPAASRWWAWADFDDLPAADWACPTCGGFLWWDDLLGGRHCWRCDSATLQRAIRLADRAAELRQRKTHKKKG